MKRLFLIFGVYFLVPSTSYAYLDPGTGSVILQYIIAGIAAAGATVLYYWKKFKVFFTKKILRKNKDDLSKNSPD